jgi:hypothetical protein
MKGLVMCIHSKEKGNKENAKIKRMLKETE